METVDVYRDKVNCNLCGKLMTINQYDRHYDRCLLLTYLVSTSKEYGENYTREDLESYEYSSLVKLYFKYNPEAKEKIQEEIANVIIQSNI